MTVTEKVAYIKGLVDGLDLDAKKDEVKVIKAIIELLDDMAMSVSDLEEGLDVVSDQVDEIDEDLSDLEGYVYEDDDDCCCGHDHEHEHHHHHHEHAAGGHSVKRVYTLQNVGCAHCAAKMEERISELDGVEDCVLVFETKQLRVTGENPDALLPQIREICSGIESEAKVIAPAPQHYG